MINLYAETDMNEKIMTRIAEFQDRGTCYKFHKEMYEHHQANVDFKLEPLGNLMDKISYDMKTGRTKTIIASTKLGSLKEDVGMIEVRLDKLETPVTAYITAVWVEENMRGKGIASIMLSVMEALCKKEGADVISLDVFDFNTDAISDPVSYQKIKCLGLLDTFDIAEQKDSGITVEKAIDGWNGHSEEKRLDYIFLNQPKQVLSSQVIFNGKNKPVVSDHFGLDVELIL